MKIKFLCVGAQKAGTTTLHEILKQHDQIVLPLIKETKFFSNDDNYRAGLEFYLAHFKAINRDDIIGGEIDPDYMYSDDAARRIYETLGDDIKLIFLLRNPVDRSYSHYLMNRKRYLEDQPFEKALVSEKERLAKGFYNRQIFSYIDRGFYSKQVRRFLNIFPPDKMMFIIFEHFIQHKEKYVRDILRFIGLKNINFRFNLDITSNPAFTPRINFLNELIYRDSILNRTAKRIVKNEDDRRKLRYKIRVFLENINNKKIKKTELVPALRKYLLDLFYADIKILESLTGLNLNVWYKPAGEK